MKKLHILLLFSILLISCDDNSRGDYDLLITNANIVDVKNNQVIRNQMIGIKDDTIAYTGPMSGRDNYDSSETLDAQGKFLIPGLWDMHVHFRGGEQLAKENKDFLKLFLSYGITTVRDAGGDITPQLLSWKKDIESGKLEGPRIFTSGPKLDGKDPAWEGSISVVSDQDVQQALDSLQDMKVDFVKIYDGSITPENFYKIIQEAEKRGMKTTGHMPMDANFLTAVDYGLDGSEHMYYIIKACSPKADSLSNLGLGYGMMNDLVDSYDENLANMVFSKLKVQKTSITPTLHIGKVLSGLADTDHGQDSTLEHIGRGIRKTYQRRIDAAKQAKASGNTMRSKVQELSEKMIVPMFNSGVNIVAGSDCGAYNSFVYPGQSLHAELKVLVDAGLTPAQALQTSVINGPKFFGLEKDYGAIEKGKIGDILILNKNPLENIENTSSIIYVIKNGETMKPRDLAD
ncbi:MAG: amidohydrolase family protein [Bacteroidota bacterium]|nr:amidohydrolase family protein [Bacteroidota bacterium]